MAFVLGRGFVDMDLDDGKFNAGLKRAGTRLKSFQAGLQSFASKAKVVLAGISAVGFFSVRSGIERQDAIANLESSMESMGGTFGMTTDQVKQLAVELHGVTGRGKTELYDMMAQMRTFGNIGSDAFKRATVAVVDLSAKMKNSDLKSAMMQLSKALEDPTRGLAALAESGISFSESEQQVIKDLQASNRLWEAQSKILDKVEQQVSGTAAKQNTGLSKSVNDMAEAFADLKEITAEILTPAIKDLSDMIKNIRDRFKEMPEAQRDVIGSFAKWGAISSVVVIALNTIGNAVFGTLSKFKTFGAFLASFGLKAKELFMWFGLGRMKLTIDKGILEESFLLKALVRIDKLKAAISSLWAALTKTRSAFSWIVPTAKLIWEWFVKIMNTAKTLLVVLKAVMAKVVLPVAAVAFWSFLVGAFIAAKINGEKFGESLNRIGDGLKAIKEYAEDALEAIISLSNALGGIMDAEAVRFEVMMEKGRQHFRRLIRERNRVRKETREPAKVERPADTGSGRRLSEMILELQFNREIFQEEKKRTEELNKQLLLIRDKEKELLDLFRERREAEDEANAAIWSPHEPGANLLMSAASAFQTLSTASPERMAQEQRKKANEKLAAIEENTKKMADEIKNMKASVYAQ